MMYIGTILSTMSDVAPLTTSGRSERQEWAVRNTFFIKLQGGRCETHVSKHCRAGIYRRDSKQCTS